MYNTGHGTSVTEPSLIQKRSLYHHKTDLPRVWNLLGTVFRSRRCLPTLSYNRHSRGGEASWTHDRTNGQGRWKGLLESVRSHPVTQREGKEKYKENDVKWKREVIAVKEKEEEIPSQKESGEDRHDRANCCIFMLWQFLNLVTQENWFWVDAWKHNSRVRKAQVSSYTGNESHC